MRCCGLMPIGHTPQTDEFTGGIHGLSLAISDKGARFCGVGRCGSQFCIDCASYAKEPRIKRIGAGVEGAIEKGYNAYFITLTIQRDSDPVFQVEALQRGWKKLQGRISYRLKKQGIQFDFVRGLDVTFRPGQHAVYHCHLHVIMVLRGTFEPCNKYHSFENMAANCWADIQVKDGVESRAIGQHTQPIDIDNGISRYLAKFEGLGNELANFQAKTGKAQKKGALTNNSIGWWELVGLVYREGEETEEDQDRPYLRVYKRFLQAVAGRRTISFSRRWDELIEPTEEEDQEPPDVVELSVSIEWFKLIKKVSSLDYFSLAAFRCFIGKDKHDLQLLLECDADDVSLRWFLARYADP